MEPTASPNPPATLERISERVREICRSGGLQESDVVLDCHDGEYLALWFDERLAVIVETDDEGGGVKLDLPEGGEGPDGPS